MITVEQALEHLFSLVSPLGSETVPLAQASGRVLAADVTATRDQPPFAASAMDGYGVRAAEVAVGAKFKIIGESAAGHGFSGPVGPGEAVRIFTGAPVPEGVDFVLLQEDCDRFVNTITIDSDPGSNANIRPAGNDFAAGFTLNAPRLLSPNDIALLAAMNVPLVQVTRRPDIALISTGDELVMPGDTPGPDQIIVSNTFGLKALFDSAGAKTRILPIAKDHPASIETAFDLAQGADLVITIGGASVGDHDLVSAVAQQLGMQQSFYKVKMRPGKPLMAGRMGDAVMIGLPGNPVSAVVCGNVFVLPVIAALQGFAPAPRTRLSATLTAATPANGPREHYMRGRVDRGQITVFDRQDSSLLTVLSEANALILRPADDPARDVGDLVEYLPL
ncbi:molybdopterin molybdotransferase [Thalassovita litoralis]|jgi:molybdopterin molybdotransferase|uniref:Molybdopterin molybdenumtransferase n=1 Tax=Thalassovita litoralis TaxID=1010611 RepID=A0A521ET81_9RHOB|nr:gephyrin-like molybdotransferase Glp [Thalassovita litoralis]SMO87129.1 molybdopterin molybdotransferase [Thalassovita litoralis]